MDVKNDVKSLVNKLDKMKMTEGNKKRIRTDEIDEANVIKLSKSLKQITEQIPMFVYRFEEGNVICDICNIAFEYKGEKEDFSE